MTLLSLKECKVGCVCAMMRRVNQAMLSSVSHDHPPQRIFQALVAPEIAPWIPNHLFGRSRTSILRQRMIPIRILPFFAVRSRGFVSDHLHSHGLRAPTCTRAWAPEVQMHPDLADATTWRVYMGPSCLRVLAVREANGKLLCLGWVPMVNAPNMVQRTIETKLTSE